MHAHRYKRDDGLDLTATLYLPPGYEKDRDGRLPCILWAYPREFKTKVQLSCVISAQQPVPVRPVHSNRMAALACLGHFFGRQNLGLRLRLGQSVLPGTL